MDCRSDGEASVTGPMQGCPDPHYAEGNDVDEDMGMNYFVNEDIDIIIDIFHLENIAETVDTTMWRENLCGNVCKYF